MTPHGLPHTDPHVAMNARDLAQKCAEEVLRQIERDKQIIKAKIAEAIEKILSTNQLTHGYGTDHVVPAAPVFMRDSIERHISHILTLNDFSDLLCGND
jgi:hypothetical protein